MDSTLGCSGQDSRLWGVFLLRLVEEASVLQQIFAVEAFGLHVVSKQASSFNSCRDRKRFHIEGSLLVLCFETIAQHDKTCMTAHFWCVPVLWLHSGREEAVDLSFALL